MGVDQQHVETEGLEQPLKPLVEQADIVPLPQHPGNFTRFDARGNQKSLARNIWPQTGRNIICRIFDAAFAPQIVIK